MLLHENLFNYRIARGLTQEAVAKGSGLCLRAYQNYERGQREPKIGAVIALADFYGLTLDELVGRERADA